MLADVLVCIVRPRGAVCVRLPLVPVAVRLVVPVVALLAALKSKEMLAPMLTVKGDDVFSVAPTGSELRATCTCPENPFSGVTLTLIALLVLPCATVTVEAENVSAKSGKEGGGDCMSACPPPQPTSKANEPASKASGTRRKRPECRARQSKRPIRSPHTAPKTA